MTLKLVALTFVNPHTGEETKVDLPESLHMELKKPCSDDKDSASFLSGLIFAGAQKTTEPFQLD